MLEIRDVLCLTGASEPRLALVSLSDHELELGSPVKVMIYDRCSVTGSPEDLYLLTIHRRKSPCLTETSLEEQQPEELAVVKWPISSLSFTAALPELKSSSQRLEDSTVIEKGIAVSPLSELSCLVSHARGILWLQQKQFSSHLSSVRVIDLEGEAEGDSETEVQSLQGE